MKILIINSIPYGSTATISCNIAKLAREAGYEAQVAFGYSYHPIQGFDFIKIGGYLDKGLHLILSRMTGLHGVFSHFATWQFIRQVKKYDPDIIHIHNLHGWYINIPMLVKYIKANSKPVVWTLHDCWAFTGHCPYYDMAGCQKWQNECSHCPSYKTYLKTYVDSSKTMFKLKKKWFSSIKNLTLVTPSQWLADQVKGSFLKDKRCIVINNGIDLSKFNIKLEDKQKTKLFKILGVAFGWNDPRKGLDVFVKLSELLGNDCEITLIGTDDAVDKILPPSINSIHQTQNQEEMISIYNQSDVFVNPTREENFPTVNIEALACGLPVITFNTGGSPEIPDETCGVVVPKNDVNALVEAIKSMKQHPIPRDVCRKRAMKFDKLEKFKEYIDLYEHLL